MYLIIVEIPPTPNPGQVVTDATCCFNKVTSKGVKVIHLFKVIGENKVVSVVLGDVEVLLTELNLAVGNFVCTTCVPMRTYEEFAEKVLKVDEKLTKTDGTHPLGSNGKTFWMHFVVEYPGKPMTSLLDNWKKEAETVLGGRAAGALDIQLYKVAAAREVHAFITMPDSGAVDDASFGLPLMLENGDNVHIQTREIKALRID